MDAEIDTTRRAEGKGDEEREFLSEEKRKSVDAPSYQDGDLAGLGQSKKKKKLEQRRDRKRPEREEDELGGKNVGEPQCWKERKTNELDTMEHKISPSIRLLEFVSNCHQ